MPFPLPDPQLMQPSDRGKLFHMQGQNPLIRDGDREGSQAKLWPKFFMGQISGRMRLNRAPNIVGVLPLMALMPRDASRCPSPGGAVPIP
jgi:hypothetical protein